MTQLNKEDTIAFWGHRSGEFAFLSNFFPHEMEISILGRRRFFSSSEHAYMHQKAVFFGDHETAQKIEEAETPREAKVLGRQVRDFDADKWASYAGVAMMTVLCHKFREEMGRKLLDTGEKTLIEASPHDTIWGVGLDASDENIYNTEKWHGKNELGNCLMAVRSLLQHGVIE
jgi:ribA/ribD-fused uncharacterized protein